MDQSIETSLMRSHNIYVKDNSTALCDPKPHCKDHPGKTHGSLSDNKQHCKDYNTEHQTSVSDDQQHCKDHLMTNNESSSSIHTISSKSHTESGIICRVQSIIHKITSLFLLTPPPIFKILKSLNFL